MNIQGYAAAWRPTNTSYAAKQTDNVSNENTFSNILHSKTEEKTQSTNKLNVFYKGVSLEEWAKTDPKYTDPETGISWYVRDGIHPYMLDEDTEKLNQLCAETGEFPLKKFGEIVGNIQQLDENTVAYVGTNGTVIKDNEGNELFIDTSHLTYDMIMDLFDNLPETDDYFDNSFWTEQVDKVSEKQTKTSINVLL